MCISDSSPAEADDRVGAGEACDAEVGPERGRNVGGLRRLAVGDGPADHEEALRGQSGLDPLRGASHRALMNEEHPLHGSSEHRQERRALSLIHI